MKMSDTIISSNVPLKLPPSAPATPHRTKVMIRLGNLRASAYLLDEVQCATCAGERRMMSEATGKLEYCLSCDGTGVAEVADDTFEVLQMWTLQGTTPGRLELKMLDAFKNNSRVEFPYNSYEVRPVNFGGTKR